MALDRQQELKQAHALLDKLPPAKLGAVRSLLEHTEHDNLEVVVVYDRPTPATVLDQLREIAEMKRPDLNANDIDAAMKIIAGTARSMGIDVK